MEQVRIKIDELNGILAANLTFKDFVNDKNF